MDKSSRKNDSGLHHSTERVLDVLELISDNPGQLTLSDISKQLGIPKSTLSPIMFTLKSRGYINSNPESRYSIGLKTHIVGVSFLNQFNFMDEAEKLLTTLTDICMETTHLAVLTGGNVLYLKKVNSPETIRMVSMVGNQLPAYCTALGKALLVDHTKAALKKLYPSGLKPMTEHTITDIDVLYDQLTEVKKTGFAVEIEESNEYVRCIAVPIYKGRDVLAAISVAIPVFRYNDEKEKLIKSALIETKRRMEDMIVSLDLGTEVFLI